MRIYLPATPQDLTGSHPRLREVRAVSPSWLAQFDDDLELAELLAHRLAAMDSVPILQQEPWARVVISADVPDATVTFIDETQALVQDSITWKHVAAFHVDEAAVEPLVQRAHQGDAGAAEQLWDADLLWYDSSERLDLIAAFDRDPR